MAEKHLTRVKYRELVLFDYHDSPEAHWLYSNSEFLLGLTNRYGKAYVDSCWNPQVRWFCLPLRRSAKLSYLLRTQELASAFTPRRESDRSFDVGFLGHPNALHKLGPDGELVYYRQRLEWILEVIEKTPPLTFCGGLVMSRQWQETLRQRHEKLADVSISEKRIGFSRYFRQMQRCKVVLAPAGVARWTYRHYEAGYAGAWLVSTDLRNTQLLVPVPEENLLLVPDGESVMPFIESALERTEADRDAAARQAGDHLERYFRYGLYHRQRPLAFERFMQQLDDRSSVSYQPGVGA